MTKEELDEEIDDISLEWGYEGIEDELRERTDEGEFSIQYYQVLSLGIETEKKSFNFSKLNLILLNVSISTNLIFLIRLLLCILL